MQTDSEDFKRWGHDELSELIDNYVRELPDRSGVVVALINYGGAENDEEINSKLLPLAMNTFGSRHYKLFGIQPVQVIYLGFDGKDGDAFLALWTCVASLPRLDEMIIYIQGKPVFRSDRLLFDVPPQGSAFFAG